MVHRIKNSNIRLPNKVMLMKEPTSKFTQFSSHFETMLAAYKRSSSPHGYIRDHLIFFPDAEMVVEGKEETNELPKRAK